MEQEWQLAEDAVRGYLMMKGVQWKQLDEWAEEITDMVREQVAATGLAVERAAVYAPQPGDIVCLETNVALTAAQLDRLRIVAEENLRTRVVVLNNAHLSGIIRKDSAAP